MRIGIMGAGAVGAYFGSLLTKVADSVVFVARGDHLAAMQEQGVYVESTLGDFHVTPEVTGDPSEAGICDLILFAVKSYDTDQALPSMAQMVGPDTTILCLQNGVANEDKIITEFGRERVLSGVAYIGVEISRPGHVRHVARGHIVFGEITGGKTDRAIQIKQLFDDAGISSDLSESVVKAKWQKFMFNCALNAMTAVTGCRLGKLMQTAGSRTVFEQILSEVYTLSEVCDIGLPGDVVSQVMATADGMDIKSSMQVDLERGKRIELETFNGYVVRLAERYDLAVPVNATLYGCLKAMTTDVSH